MMNKCRISVLKRTYQPELAKEYGCENLGPCETMREGMTWETDFGKPDGLCDEAWKAMHHYVFTLAHNKGSETFFDDSWIRTPGVAVCCCNDGLRPVIFKIEAIPGAGS